MEGSIEDGTAFEWDATGGAAVVVWDGRSNAGCCEEDFPCARCELEAGTPLEGAAFPLEVRNSVEVRTRGLYGFAIEFSASGKAGGGKAGEEVVTGTSSPPEVGDCGGFEREE